MNQLNYCIIIGWLSIRWRRNSRQWIWIKQYQTVIYAKSCSHGFYQLLELKVFCVHYQSSFFNCHFYSLYYIQTAIWRWLSLLLFFPIFISSFLFFHVFPLRQQQAFSNDIGFVSVSSEVNIFLAAVHIWARRNISIYSQFIYAHAHGKVARAKMLNSDSRRNNFNNFFTFLSRKCYLEMSWRCFCAMLCAYIHLHLTFKAARKIINNYMQQLSIYVLWHFL